MKKAELRDLIDMWREVATVRGDKIRGLEERLTATQKLVAQQAMVRGARFSTAEAGARVTVEGDGTIRSYDATGVRVFGPPEHERVPDPEARLAWCPRCSDGPMLIAPRRICDECETEVGLRSPEWSAVQKVAERIKALAVQSARIDDWTRDRTAAMQGAATTLQAHTWDHRTLSCVCGWSQRQTVGRRAAQLNHPYHVAEQLAAVGALGDTEPVAARPVLIDRDGDEWWPSIGDKYVHEDTRLSGSRAVVEAKHGPVIERFES